MKTLLAVVFLSVPLTFAANELAPKRIVSINLCADELLLTLAGPGQVQSVTWLVKDPQTSWAAELAAEIPANRGLAEEVMLFEPDLVVAGAWSTPATRNALERLGVRIVTLEHPESFAAAKIQIRKLAGAIGRPREGEQLLAAMDQRLSRVNNNHGRVTGLYLQENGVTTGAGSLADDLMRLAGVTNLAAGQTANNYARFSLEELVVNPPDLLIIDDQSGASPALANEILRHRILRKAFTPTRTVRIPGQAWSCGSPYMLDAIEQLADAAAQVRS